jgi:hypothetical protein
MSLAISFSRLLSGSWSPRVAPFIQICDKKCPLRGSTAPIDQLNVYADNSWFTLADPFQHAIHGRRIHRFSRTASLQKDILRAWRDLTLSLWSMPHIIEFRNWRG